MNKYPDGKYLTRATATDSLRQVTISDGLVKVDDGFGYEFEQEKFFKVNSLVEKIEEVKDITLTDKLTQATSAIILAYHAKNSERSLEDCAAILLSEKIDKFSGNLLGYFIAKGWELEDNQEFDDFLDKLLTKYFFID